jgi:carboxymethylenebutenolidase
MKPLLALLPLTLLAGCAAHTFSDPPPAPVRLLTGKGEPWGVLHRPAGHGPFPALVLVHGDFGLTDAVKSEAERLAGRGYVVLAVDLYHGEAVGDLMEAHIMSRMEDGPVLADLKGAVDYLIALPNVRGDAVGILGWDMGGGYALDAAIADPRLHAVVVCYGRLTTDAELLASLQAPVLGIFAGQDEGITPQTIEQFRAAMTKAGKRVAGLHVYPKCPKDFLDPKGASAPQSPEAEARADTRAKIEAFLDAELRQ